MIKNTEVYSAKKQDLSFVQKALAPVFGYYIGPYHSDGKFQSSVDGKMEPYDKLDSYAREHDRLYYEASKLTGDDQLRALNAADKIFIDKASKDGIRGYIFAMCVKYGNGLFRKSVNDVVQMIAPGNKLTPTSGIPLQVPLNKLSRKDVWKIASKIAESPISRDFRHLSDDSRRRRVAKWFAIGNAKIYAGERPPASDINELVRKENTVDKSAKGQSNTNGNVNSTTTGSNGQVGSATGGSTEGTPNVNDTGAAPASNTQIPGFPGRWE